MRYRTKKQMKRIVALFYFFIFLFFAGCVACTATILQAYWLYAAWMTITGLVGVVVTDSILRSNDADLAELIRKDKEEDEDEAAR